MRQLLVFCTLVCTLRGFEWGAWREFRAAAPRPTARYAPGGIVTDVAPGRADANASFTITHGLNNQFGSPDWLDDTWVFSTGEERWLRLQVPSESRPTARYGHTVGLVQPNSFAFFGGHDSDGQSTVRQVREAIHSVLSFASAWCNALVRISVFHQMQYVQGTNLNDLWLFSEEKKWTRVVPTATATWPSPRSLHTWSGIYRPAVDLDGMPSSPVRPTLLAMFMFGGMASTSGSRPTDSGSLWLLFPPTRPAQETTGWRWLHLDPRLAPVAKETGQVGETSLAGLVARGCATHRGPAPLRGQGRAFPPVSRSKSPHQHHDIRISLSAASGDEGWLPATSPAGADATGLEVPSDGRALLWPGPRHAHTTATVATGLPRQTERGAWTGFADVWLFGGVQTQCAEPGAGRGSQSEAVLLGSEQGQTANRFHVSKESPVSCVLSDVWRLSVSWEVSGDPGGAKSLKLLLGPWEHLAPASTSSRWPSPRSHTAWTWVKCVNFVLELGVDVAWNALLGVNRCHVFLLSQGLSYPLWRWILRPGLRQSV